MSDVIERLTKCSKALEAVGLSQEGIVCATVYGSEAIHIQLEGPSLDHVRKQLPAPLMLAMQTEDHFALDHDGIRWIAIVRESEQPELFRLMKVVAIPEPCDWLSESF